MAAWYSTGGTGTTSSTSTVYINTSTSTTTYPSTTATTGAWINSNTPVREIIPSILTPNKKMEIRLKDGTKIFIDDNHNLRIDDKDSKVTYQANRNREFNRFINASDLLEEFIRDMGQMGATQGNILDTPINVFIHWLIYKAAKQDGDPTDGLRVYQPPKCLACGRFVSRRLADQGFQFCGPEHAAQHYERLQREVESRAITSDSRALQRSGGP